MRALIIVPTYNEADNLPNLIPAVLAVTPPTVDLLIVDDGSPDGTGKIADRFAAENSRVSALHRSGKQGLGTAYVAGFKRGLADAKAYDALIEMDADFSHDP